MNDTARELGAAAGIAIIGSAFNAGYRGHVGDLVDSFAGPLGDAVTNSPAAGLQAAAQLEAIVRQQVAAVVQSGVIAGWETAFVVATAIIAAGAVYVAVRFPQSPPAHGGRRLGQPADEAMSGSRGRTGGPTPAG